MAYLLSIILIPFFSCAGNAISLRVEGKVVGNLDMSAISCMGSKKCLIASDETNSVQFAQIENEALKVSRSEIKLGKYKKENDLEAMTQDGKFFYAIGSHGLSKKKGKYQPSRYQIFKIEVADDGKLISLKKSNLEKILKKIDGVKNFFKKKLQSNGVNIEGMAYNRGKLYIGFRSPVINGMAQVISFNSEDFWNGKQVKAERLEIDLKHNRGVRSMEFFGDKLHIIAGESSTSDVTNSELAVLNFGSTPSFKSVPFADLKLEGFDFVGSNKVFVYDSQINGKPTFIKN